MAYKYDGDLEFLREMKDEDLNGLVDILIYDKDGETRWSENLTTNEFYKKYNPQHQKYLDVILEEIQRFGGHTAVNTFRGSGVLYREILCDVCDKCKVNYNKKSNIAIIEQNLLMKILEKSMEKMSADELKELAKEFNLSGVYTKQAIMLGLQTSIRTGAINYQLAVMVADSILKFLFGRGLLKILPVYTAFIPSVSTGIFAGPVGLALTGLWTLSDLAGPAYRVTIPVVIQIAFLRQEKLRREKEEKSFDLSSLAEIMPTSSGVNSNARGNS